ncbi:MAG: protein kinase [Thermoguttaceae bacterium]
MNDHRTTCDPERIELFLEQKLSDEEQSVFESHLSSCGDCRQWLETAAASEDIWAELRESLRDEQLPPDGLRCGDSDSTDEDASSSQTTVLKLLAPTDDDRMLGRWGTYEVMGVVGTGGMGVVLKAFDAALNRYVAIKVLAPHLGSSGAARKRFSREAQAAAAVVHDNVIEIYHVAETAGLPYLVMPYVRGPSLQRRLDDGGPLALVEILRVGMQAAAGLAAAHAQGLVHRDVKPANILLADGIERVKLTDFGLARAADDASLTKTGVIAGTPQYMSPEQARGEAVDQRSDLFSLGSVLYAMCTGRPPFRAETTFGVLRRITDEEPRPIRENNPEIPEWLCGIVSKLMAKRPDDRFPSAEEVAKLLEECLAHVQQPSVPLPNVLISLREMQTQVSTAVGTKKDISRSEMSTPRCITRRVISTKKGTLAMFAFVGIALFAVGAVVTQPPDISGQWQGEGWGQVTLTQTAPGEYTGTYTDTVAKEKEPGKIDLKWSRIEHRFNGTWREGDDDRFGDLSVRLADGEIRGALTTDAKSKVNPATPRLADLTWMPSNAPQSQGVWNVTTDFSVAKGNPNGVWTYGMVKGATFVPYTVREDDERAARCWRGNLSDDGSPLLGVWRGAAAYGVQRGQFYLHPAPGGEASTARWTAPAGISPRVHVQGRFFPGDLGGKEAGIFVNGIPGVNAPYWHSAIRPEYYHEEDEEEDGARAVHPKSAPRGVHPRRPAQTAVRAPDWRLPSAPRGVHPRRPARFDFLLDVSPGDTVDFAVYGGYMGGSTPLEATITSVAESRGGGNPFVPAVWDVSNNFSIAKGNPNGTWTYGMVYKSAFVPYTKKTDDGQNRLWLGHLAGDGAPELGIKYGPPANGAQSGQFFLHPGPDGEASVARWTAPAGFDSTVQVQGQFLPGDYGIMQVGIFVNGTPQVTTPYWTSSDSGTFSFSVPVSAGNTIDFAVYGGYVGGVTPLEATIASVAESRGRGASAGSSHALQFDGNGGSYVDVANPTGLPTGMSARTMSVWFKLANADEHLYQTILGYGPNLGVRTLDARYEMASPGRRCARAMREHEAGPDLPGRGAARHDGWFRANLLARRRAFTTFHRAAGRDG